MIVNDNEWSASHRIASLSPNRLQSPVGSRSPSPQRCSWSRGLPQGTCEQSSSLVCLFISARGVHVEASAVSCVDGRDLKPYSVHGATASAAIHHRSQRGFAFCDAGRCGGGTSHFATGNDFRVAVAWSSPRLGLLSCTMSVST